MLNRVGLFKSTFVINTKCIKWNFEAKKKRSIACGLVSGRNENERKRNEKLYDPGYLICTAFRGLLDSRR